MKRVRLIRNSILRAFAESVYYNQDRLYRLWIVSPWIGLDEGRGDAVLHLIESLRGKRCELTLFTRPPAEAWHRRAIELLRKNLNPIIYQSPTLHTKLYVLECNGFRSAILGSPNLTPRANRINQEIAVEFRSTNDDPTDNISAVLLELIEYASSLREVCDLL
jgi:phosphatidylserine/phosphatidylglycerophosphate/cardiolipin synthase-like enzyme